jgi:hypothetical protein
MRKGKRWKVALAVAGALVAVQLAASAFVRTRPVRSYLLAHLERTFGRTVEVNRFTVSLLPSPQLDAAEITVSEDPAFGNEYFLRADHLSAGLRWLGLLRGRFEFGTVTLDHPSLILARNSEGRWNLEGWLPPGPASPSAGRSPGSPAKAETTNLLERIDINSGRLDFKLGDVKQPFAFTDVSGSIEQTAPGRWELHLEAQPWRSGVQLQSPGTLRVQGEVAGTSARLQPAQLQIHWGDASLADLFRLFRGQDEGVRGLFALDASAESGIKNDGTQGTGEWSYSLEARATQIHRWDLTERGDNPRVNVRLAGRWNPALGIVEADEAVVEAPLSDLRGTASFFTKPNSAFEIHVDSAGIQAADLLAWYRAFQPHVDEGVAVKQYFTGALTLRGWPLSLDAAAFSSRGGLLTIPGLGEPVRVGQVRGGIEGRRFVVEPVSFTLGVGKFQGPVTKKKAPREQLRAEHEAAGVELSVIHNFETHEGAVTIEGHLAHAEDALKAAAAFGRPLNHGWELSGGAQASLLWGWPAAAPADSGQSPGRGWNGTIEFSGAKLQAAGLNLPVQLDDVQFEWQQGVRSVHIGKAHALGAEWSGKLAEDNADATQTNTPWMFDLHADHLDAMELDRWVGPRARPNWLQRLMASLFGGSAPSVPASALLRKVNARGELQVDEFELEKVKLQDLQANVSLQNLRLELSDAKSKWAGGTLRGTFSADFSPQPKYTAAVRFDRVSLAQISLAGRVAERLSGLASGAFQLATAGVGRDALLHTLEGEGEVRVANVQFRGWDVAASLQTGAPREGASRWSTGEGAFHIADQSFDLDNLRLNGAAGPLVLKGTISFQREADLTLEAAGAENRKIRTASAPHVLNLAGPLDRPKVSLASRSVQQPGD